MDNAKDILFASVNLPVLDKNLATAQLLEVDDNSWFWNSFRATHILPLMTKNAEGGAEGAVNSRAGDFCWLPHTPKVIKEWFEETVFPWMGQKTRVMALMTQPGFKNNEHIDCDPKEIGTMQHKFRIVVKGNTDTLYFKTLNGDVRPSNTELPFIMDGGWPHGMNNYSNEIKITLAAGAPWTGLNNYTDINLDLRRSDYNLPTDVLKYTYLG